LQQEGIVASPIGHILAGVGVAGAVTGLLGADGTPALWAGAAVAGCLPDLDLFPSLWGVPYHRVHRQASHSILILGPMIAVCWMAAWTFDLPADRRVMAGWTAALMSHLLLDILCTGPVLGRQGHGIPLLWPLTRRRWYVRQPMLPEVNLLEGASPGLIIRACARELVHLGPAAGALLVLGHLL
jgi:membrane-bound metal-dependent hydrolase YbcI (DUF457 family)